MLPSRSAGFPSPDMPVTLDTKGCSPSSAKASFVPPLLSPQSCAVSQRSRVNRRRPCRHPKRSRRCDGPPTLRYPVPGPFLFLKKVQSGSYGEAIVVRELDSTWLQGVSPGRVLCMKMFNKATSQLRGLIPGIVQEVLAYRNLARARSRRENEGSGFVMDLEASLQDEKRLFFVMELMDCDLLAVFNGYRFLRRPNARRWICQIALGLSAIHASGVIHRDIKPENLLLDANGDIRISDFGSAHSELGPKRRNTGLAVDYWSLGCVAFELVAEEPESLFDSEEELRRYLLWHQHGHSSTSEEAESLVSGLLAIDPSRRYHIADLRAHPYFQHDDGSSEFEHTVSRTRQRRHQIYLDPTVEPELVGGHAAVLELSLDPPEMAEDDTFEHFGWVNPSGIWGLGEEK
ncbi:kinase-like domain-containing protein, partial [Mycena latifolia]